MASLVVIDLAGLNDPDQRPSIVKNIGNVCRESGFFQIINHGISQKVIDDALGTAFGFFNLPTTEKTRDKMGDYVTKVRQLAMELMSAITESLGIGPKYIENKMEDGMQVMAVNCYPKCPEPHLALRLAPHSDHSCITILHHSSCGLEIMDASDGTWRLVPDLHGALQVLVGDHMEVLSNGLYKSTIHRVTLNNDKTRVSIASLHSMGMDEKMAPAEKLITDERPKKYKESTFRDFLNFLTRNDISEGKTFIESLKIY